MRKITVTRLASYLLGLLFLVAFSARLIHADAATAVFFPTPYVVFGTQPGVTQTSLIMSTGTGPVTVTIQNITISGANPGDFVAAGSGATPCNPGSQFSINTSTSASCTIGVTFKPTATGTRTATISVSFTVSAGLFFSPTTVSVVGGDEIVYATTGSGGQVLTVDGANGDFQILSNGPACGTPPCFQPQGAVVGPDGKIYMTDQANNNIWRMNQDSTQLELVYNGAAAGCPDSSSPTIPCMPEGPSFSGSGTGDLYFNTFVPVGTAAGLFVISGVATTPFGGPFNSPANVNASNPEVGTGTGFDAGGNLFAADQEDDTLWIVAPPYSHNTATEVLFDLGGPVGIALNKANGQVYFSTDGGKILQVVPPNPELYSTTTYYTFTSTTGNCPVTVSKTDLPEYFQFDMNGSAFVVTSTGPLNENGQFTQGCGKVWRIDPAGPTANLLLDLNAVNTTGIPGVCGGFGGCFLNNTQAVGLAMPPTAGPTQTVPLSSTGGTVSVGWPIGCTPTNTPPNNCSSTIGVQYPANMFSNSDTLNVTFSETSQQQFVANAGASPYAKTTLAPVEGYNGNGIVPTLLCTNGGGGPCNDTVTPGTPYNIFTTWQSNQANYCSLTPHLLRGDPAGGPYTSLADTITGCTDGGVGTKGQSSCSSTSSSSCLSDWLNTFGSIFQFVGFGSPITNSPTVNVAKAGQAVPVAFQVLDGSGNPIANLTMPPVSIVFAPAPCSTFNTAGDTTIDASAAGNSGFQNLGGGNYQFNWKTAKSLSGTCGQLQVNLGDGVLHTADFKFK